MIEWLIETLLAVTLLMLLVLAVRRPVAHFFGAGWAYSLWLLPALRLVLPPLPRLAPDIALPSIAPFIPALGGVTAPLSPESAPGQWVPFLLALWAGGAVTFLLWNWLAYRAFLSALKAGSRPGDPPSYGGISTLASDAVDGPLALGMIERWIVLPSHFLFRYSAGERRLAMEHELVHHRRGDIWWNLAGLVILAANWFNPVAWFAFHAFRSDQELACDAVVAKHASSDERRDYARAMVKAASRPGLIAACPLNPADQLKHRLRMVREHRGGKARAAGGLAAFAGMFVAFLAVSSSALPGDAPAPVAYAAALPSAARPTAIPAAADWTPTRAIAAPAGPRALRSAAPSNLVRAPSPAFAAAMEAALKAHALEAGSGSFAMLGDAAVPLAAGTYLDRTVHGEVARIQPAAAPSGARIRLRGARVARVVTIHIDANGAHITVTGGSEPVRLETVHAGLERTIAKADKEHAMERLGEALAALGQKDRFGMVSTVD